MRYIAWTILFILSVIRGVTQVFPDLQFTHLTVRDGLSSNGVGYITQDKEGFMWFGTEDGLNRFDGYRIRRFYHAAGKENSLVNNSIYGIYPDRRDNLWICTAEGISHYDKKSGAFRNFRHDPNDPASLEDDQFTSFYQDAKNTAWIATTRGLYRFDSSFRFTRVLTGFQKFQAEGKEISSFAHIYEDRDHHVWASALTWLYRLDDKTMRVEKQFGPFAGNITAIFQDDHRRFWIGAFLGGLRLFNPADGSITEVRLESPSQVVNAITEWKDQNNFCWLVLGTDDGIILLDPASLRSKMYGFQPGYLQQRSLSGNNVLNVFVDRQNILWIATDEGVSYVEPSRQLFDLWNIYTPRELTSQPILDFIYSCCENQEGLWMTRWIDTGLFCFRRNGELLKRISRINVRGASLQLKDNLKPFYLLAQGDSVLWFTTNVHIVRYDLRSEKAEVYRIPDSSENIGLRSIVQIDDHTWWIRTRNNGVAGIFEFDPIARKFTRHYRDTAGCRDCAPPYLLDLMQTSKKDIFLTSRVGGLFKYDRPTGRFVPEFRFESKEAPQHSNTFESIAEDKQGILWIGTFTGLFAYDPVSKKVVHDYSTNEMFGNVDVGRVFIDERENIWMNTQRGIFCIIRSTGQIRQFSIAEGLPNNLTYGILQADRNHFVYSGISGHIVRIRPDGIMGYSHASAPVHFSEATIMDNPSNFGSAANGEKQLIIEPGQNRFTLDFSVMNYDMTGNNRYYYLLDGVMTAWQQNENGHLAFYNLPQGTYTLHVRGGDKYGGMFRGEDAVLVVVRPNWWQTAWFKSACIALTLLLAVIFIRRRIMVIRKEASIKQKMAETEMMALRSQMNPHFIFNSLNSIENFMMKNEKRLASNYLNKFARLVRMILDSSRNELVPIIRDMEALQLYVDLEQLRFNNKFSFHMEIDPVLRDSDHRVPSLLIQPYIENAIVHGLAHSEKEGLRLTIAAWLEGEYINYIIEDNGIGRQLSGMYNRQNKPHHKSVGLKITEERINIFNQQQRAKGHVRVVDLHDQDGSATGTRIEIRIKAI
ncbi:MAG: two-component regulator propeller domain-containing protein [Bacteroidota bacterium]|nr:two-component regulator propeller domain-containing protein [Bacteroidota bacterium]MDP4259432.1 two-component regulator propeller domain-containing protein [Bacteroidota bacterium]